MTKTEGILDRVKTVNGRGDLAGLGTSPTNPNFGTRKFRFIKRLYERGVIVWVKYTPKYGAGWATPETRGIFKC
ncbi:MAG: hypothetical protein WC565_05315 [Parcubacteria group bacterium]